MNRHSANSPLLPAIFLDRDGVINENRADYVKSWQEFSFLPGALTALAQLAQMNLPIIVVSNQSAVGRGLIDRSSVDDIHRRMIADILSAGGRVDAIFYCPHRPEEACTCRKPQPGMLLAAAEQLHLNLAGSIFIGDAETDVQAAQQAGCFPLLVRTGRGQREEQKLLRNHASGYLVLDDLAEAAAWLVEWAIPTAPTDPTLQSN